MEIQSSSHGVIDDQRIVEKIMPKMVEQGRPLQSQSILNFIQNNSFDFYLYNYFIDSFMLYLPTLYLNDLFIPQTTYINSH